MKSFEEIEKIDAHVHFNTVRDPLFKYGQENNFRFLSINTDMPLFSSLEMQKATNLSLIEKHHKRLHFVTSFSCAEWQYEGWQEKVIHKIKSDLQEGAIGVKVWKNIGMALKDGETYVSIDHERFDPIFNFLEENDIVLLGHIGEPKNCWLPLDQMTVRSDRDYFSKNEEYHMYLHPECLGYDEHLKARDRMLEKHPKLRYVGLHLASQEWDTDEVAGFLDKFPTAMVDLAERICHLQHQAITDWKKVRAFLMDYQDRIIYGTDCVDENTLTDKELVEFMDGRYRSHWEFFTGHHTMTVPKVTGQFRAMNLPHDVVEKIYSKNAINTYGI
ncbi:amidohydrolase family protein [Pareuzebyella sediminis]|uniref:amidohydrolase family protein n=1 Tax=Pareuzebyella sediminis TaxID=2607998 RepID=UPI0011EBB0DF|nr:amidohydrolase family protein [Pareuzebyella sediminis]